MERLDFSAPAAFSEFGSVAALEVLSSARRESLKNVVVHARAIAVRVERSSVASRPRSLTCLDDVAVARLCLHGGS